MRLTRTADIQRVQRTGQGWTDQYAVLRVAPNGLDRTRFGFTVSKRLGNAVRRNAMKRRLRESVRSMLVKPGWDVVFIARLRAAGADFDGLATSVRSLLARADLIGL